MTIKELIEKLKKFDENLTVIYNETGAGREIGKIYLINYDNNKKAVFLD